MKKCPKCNAEIEENARFCLYCMTSLEAKQKIEFAKQKKKPMLLAAVGLLCVVIIFGVWFLASGGDSDKGKKKDTAASQNTSSDKAGDFDAENENAADDSDDDIEVNSPSNTGSETNDTPDNEKTPIGGGNTDGETDTNIKNDETPEEGNGDTTANEPTQSNVTYSYIEGNIENCYPTGYSALYAPENAIVITKVNGLSENGVYDIPETIDGKKVAAIMPNAFSNPVVSQTVSSVILPATVRTIWNNAFSGCYNLSDVYIKSAVIGIYKDAFAEVSKRTADLTIHCSHNCRNYDYYYYRNIAGQYDAEYKEWNG